MIRDLIGAYDRVGSIETCLIRSSSPDGVLVNASGSFPTVPAEPRTTLEELTLACGERELWHGGHGLGHQSGRSASGEEIGGPPFVRLGVTVSTSKARADHWQPRRTWDEPALHALRIPSFARELLREVKELKRIVECKDVDAHLQRADQEKDPEPVVRGAMFPSRDATEILLRYEPEKGFPLTIWASGVAPRSLKQPPPQVEGVLMKALTVAMEARRGSVPSVSYRGHFEPQSLQIRPGGSRQQFLDWWEEFISRGQPLVPSGKKDIYLVSWRMALSPSQ
ncbi:MAG: hypothetical protein IPK72_21260 [Candidatus Eisenbacteria bacterium]|nr:hypothetical protein [Candidatus Eisenbacteria bacterium]